MLNIIQTPTRRILPVRSLGDIHTFVVHTTGFPRGAATDVDALGRILDAYNDPQGCQPHYLIEISGAIHGIVDERKTAYHCKIEPEEKALYIQGYQEWSRWIWKEGKPSRTMSEYSGYRHWRDDWVPKQKQSPLSLITGAHPNLNSIGIELQQPMKPGKDNFADAQYQALAELLYERSIIHKVPLDRDHLYTHYDCSPMRRSSASGSWDPPESFKWNRVFDLLHSLP